MSIRFLNKGGSSVAIKPNIFMQETEPEIKEGIWLKKNGTYDGIILDTSIASGMKLIQTVNWTLPFTMTTNQITILNNELYLPGSNKKFYKYNLDTEEFTELADLPIDMSQGSITTDGNNIYLGFTSTSPRDLYRYNVTENTFTQLASTSAAFSFSRLCYKDGFLYIFGGFSGSNYYSSIKYHIASNKYTSLASMPFDAQHCEPFIVGEQIFLFGSYRNNHQAKVAKYDIETNTMTQLNNSPISSTTDGTIGIVNGNLIYIKFSNKNTDYIYDTKTDTYTEIDQLIVGSFDWSTPYVTDNHKLYFLRNNFKELKIVSLDIKEFETNKVLVQKGTGSFKAEIVSLPENVQGELNIDIKDVYLTTENGLDDTIPTYYGNGTEWIKFKN